MEPSELWASDSPISQPEPVRKDLPVLKDFGGIAFTAGGLAHNITETDIEEVFHPFFSPDGEIPDDRNILLNKDEE